MELVADRRGILGRILALMGVLCIIIIVWFMVWGLIQVLGSRSDTVLYLTIGTPYLPIYLGVVPVGGIRLHMALLLGLLLPLSWSMLSLGFWSAVDRGWLKG
ncbi:hypothetical protein GGR54DRAFT_604273 [Hypoxylon sp. NC1633]|nr:hypothetical protein GGR54DRAFT_604273 [Hypoxylon sp. NC1633]